MFLLGLSLIDDAIKLRSQVSQLQAHTSTIFMASMPYVLNLNIVSCAQCNVIMYIRIAT